MQTLFKQKQETFTTSRQPNGPSFPPFIPIPIQFQFQFQFIKFHFIIAIGLESNKIFRLIKETTETASFPRHCFRMAIGLGSVTSLPKSR